MKSISQFFAAVLSITMLITCAAQSQMPDEGLYRQWMLEQFQDFKKEEFIKNQSYLDFSRTKSPKDYYRAKISCNDLVIKAKFQTGNKVKFTPLIGTQRFCENKMEMEKAFATALLSMTTYELKGHTLILKNSKGEVMKFLAADWD